jgi:cleavage and polyadenylation specificity factor subunit 6/7
LYDDVLTSGSNNLNNSENNASSEHNTETETNGSYQGGNMHSIARRYQLYVGNLTWWTTDQDITDAVVGTGVSDFQEVKFFENRANGQSKGFCVITLGSESSMRIVLENLPKKDLNGQAPVVTLPTKQALNQFESQQKTRPTPPVPPNQKSGMGGSNSGPNMMNPNMPPMNHPRMMNPNPMRGPMPMQNSQMMNPGMQQRMQPGNGGPLMNHPPQMNNMPPRFQNNWNNGPPRPPPNGMPNRPPMMNPQGPPMPMMNRPPMNMNMNRPFGPNRPMHPGNFNQGQQNMNMPPRGPIPMNNQGPPAPHVNPAFFNNQGPVQNIGPPGNPHFNQQGPRPMWPGNNKMPGFENAPQAPGPAQPPISEVEFEEIMGRNRTVSSSAIARAVSDAAAGEYSSAIETLATAISLIKQSKVASDERCKILINSLQDTLQGIEAKNFNRRDRSDRSRSRERRRRRERSNSRSYRRSRSREHRDHRDRGRDE